MVLIRTELTRPPQNRNRQHYEIDDCLKDNREDY